MDFVDGEVAFDEGNADGLAASDLVVFVPYAAVEGVLLGFEAGLVGAVLVGGALVAASSTVEGSFKAGKQEQGEVGLEVAAEEFVEGEDGRRAKLAAASLVGLR